ncbi:Hypothetical predicted protein [Cloeon dipterum]|uniref:C2H2-type domain-containing protein n=1 Tax=Cloeon dipterum TaxID=197152 RepID=A0A8S1DGV2_9INSE|nr:Hypothetical predicted protein [Cloeon dipterum]
MSVQPAFAAWTATFFNVQNSKGDAQENESSEDEFVDVEGGCDLLKADLLPPCKSLQAPSVEQDKTNPVFCGKCDLPFNNIDDCRNHIEKVHESPLLENSANEQQEKNKNKLIKVPLQMKCKRNILEISKLAKPVAAIFDKEMTASSEHKVEIRVQISEACENFRCEICSLNFDRAESLKWHKDCHIPRKPGFSCLHCKKYCRTWADCSAHLWKSHKTDLRRFVCDICNSKFTKRFMMINHFKKHLGIYSYACTLCGKKFSQNSQLKQHKLTHIPVSDRPTKKDCPICFNTYVDHRSLRKHIHEVHGTEKSYVCPTCDFRANGAAALRSHQRSHLTEKSLKCDQCSFETVYKESLRRHKMLHSNSKKYQCPFCNASFIQSAGLKKHLLRKHSDKPGLVKICSKCPFSTINEDVYKNHFLRTHSKETTTGVAQPASEFDGITLDCLIPLTDKNEPESKNLNAELPLGISELYDCSQRSSSPSYFDVLPSELVETYSNPM